MWVFADFGLLMPAAVPMDKADERFTEGKYDLQVRGRVEDHLRYFMDHYMEPGTFHDEIEFTPKMDYNVRFYTTNEAFARALSSAVMDIDYKKFKPMAERKDTAGKLVFSWGPEYHDVLNSIWSVVTRLGDPGGIWGDYSLSNPLGSKPLPAFSSRWGSKHSREYGNYAGARTTYERYDEFSASDPELGFFEKEWTADFTPKKQTETEQLLDELHKAYIPSDQWSEYLEPYEFELVKPFMKKARKEERKRERAIARTKGYRRGRQEPQKHGLFR